MDVLQYLQQELTSEIEVMKEDLASGKAKNFDEYRHSSGVIRGLLIARNKIAEMAERLENSDE
jgi:sugar-specific transcriptional regulator TrmB